MVTVLFQSESHYPVNKKTIRDAVDVALKNRFKRTVEVSISIVGNRKMHKLNKTYRNIDAPTDVLSFSLSETSDPSVSFTETPDDILRLGDIVVSYPEAVLHAKTDNTLVDQAVVKLVLHGLNHLLGIHHPE